jgi:hypothetical protein
MSGSNQWELEFEKDGVKVYSLKSPGSSLKKFKGIARANYSLSQLSASFVEDNHMETCRDWLPGCSDFQSIEPFNSQTMSDVELWKIDLIFPFSPRETLMRGFLYQDKQSKELFAEFIAAPNIIPPNEGCVRVKHMHNTWRYTPLENGEIEIEFVQDMDIGGLLPDFLLNFTGAHGVYTFLHDILPKMMNQEKYLNAKFDFIEEAVTKADVVIAK